MALEFHLIDIGEPLNTLEDLYAALSLREELLKEASYYPPPVEAFNEEYDKLAPWVFACRRAGIPVGLFFDDTYLCTHQIAPALKILRDCYGEIAAQRPFYHPDDWQKEPFVRMVKVLETAIAKNAALVAYCD